MTGPFPPLLLVGAGRMGGALFAGWCRAGLAPSVLVEPAGFSGARAADRVVATLAEVPGDFRPEAAILCVKPQKAAEVLPALAPLLAAGTAVLSIMAGIRIDTMRSALGGAAVVRAMPNTPAAIGRGMTVGCAGPGVSAAQHALCERLVAAVGEVAWVEHEAELDAVTAVSGSGPAYFFLLTELLERAARDEGLSPELSARLARQTAIGAGALLEASGEAAAVLRRNVTSPGGTTERALSVLMAEDAWPRSVAAAVREAVVRARELAG